MKIQKLGNLVGVSPQHAILRATEKMQLGSLPRLRSEVVTEDLSRVGTINDIFGPASAPFISIRPDSKESLENLSQIPRGTTFYVKPFPPRKKSRSGKRNAQPNHFPKKNK
jgi:rRNA processing protein Gar1